MINLVLKLYERICIFFMYVIKYIGFLKWWIIRSCLCLISENTGTLRINREWILVPPLTCFFGSSFFLQVTSFLVIYPVQRCKLIKQCGFAFLYSLGFESSYDEVQSALGLKWSFMKKILRGCLLKCRLFSEYNETAQKLNQY